MGASVQSRAAHRQPRYFGDPSMRHVQLDFVRENRTAAEEWQPQDAGRHQTSGRDEAARAVDRAEVPRVPIELVYFELIGIIVGIQELALDAIYLVSESVALGEQLRIIVYTTCGECVPSRKTAGVLPIACRNRGRFAARSLNERRRARGRDGEFLTATVRQLEHGGSCGSETALRGTAFNRVHIRHRVPPIGVQRQAARRVSTESGAVRVALLALSVH